LESFFADDEEEHEVRPAEGLLHAIEDEL